MRHLYALAVLIPLLTASTALAAPEFYSTVDRKEVGTEDTFSLTIVMSNTPADAQLQFSPGNDFEVLSRQQANQFSYNMGPGGGGVSRVTKYILILRANRTGTLTIPSATLKTSGGDLKTDAIQITVKRGSVPDPNAPKQLAQQLPDPFGNFPGEDDWGIADPTIPRSDSDLFIRAAVSADDVYVGEQVNYSIYVYARTDVSSVDALVMPKLEGFWGEDLEAPTQLAAETKIVNGVPYRVYLLRRRAIFPMKPGTLTIEPARADITMGIFDSRKTTRKTQELTLKVKPLPPNPPAGMNVANVGKWRLFTEVSSTKVELGQPVTVKVTVEGRGNLHNVTPPPLTGPQGLKIYNPTVTDKVSNNRTRVAGARTHEYLVLPQQTGTFTLPALQFPYFDPETGQYDVSKTDPITLTVVPNASGQVAMNGNLPNGNDSVARNVLTAGGLRAPRVATIFKPAAAPLYARPWFLPLAIAPAGLFGLSLIFSALRSRQSVVDEGTLKKRKARDARRRLAGAEKLKSSGKPDEFYGEVEKALTAFLEARLGYPVQGLTRDQLKEKLKGSNVAEARIASVVSVLDACDLGRFAPGAAGHSRDQVLDQAEAAMEGWQS